MQKRMECKIVPWKGSDASLALNEASFCNLPAILVVAKLFHAAGLCPAVPCCQTLPSRGIQAPMHLLHMEGHQTVPCQAPQVDKHPGQHAHACSAPLLITCLRCNSLEGLTDTVEGWKASDKQN